ncbi:TetR/AcrR family transcriptional regulator [Gordonia rhizosphera]|uniref:Putative TetR family transcriptional regulator n=1 Tax=Gordonia rhizosphera NBRC 16068 TaxID=1108045 RepID=K6W3P6_9ACTN|nr:TetR/AcrR family transcriptional regulator [Gordonia rhizosphera]GAB93780.1 putative TetR family transcriptional regulator [Gordonia rhizosphera NBRC 16068]
MTGPTEISDKRLLKGAKARATIARHAADVASVDGLTGLSLGKLAADLGLSKSGVSTLFGSKENLQLAAIEAAREVFVDHVIVPALPEPTGMPRLRALVDNWLAYVSDPVMPGGCFRVATTVEFDSRTGPVHDAIDADRKDWQAFLEKEIRAAQTQGHLTGREPHAVAFALDAIVGAANTGARMGDESALPTARSIIENLLGDGA